MEDLGFTDFQKHVVVYERYSRNKPDTLPTFLVKMSPWSESDIDKLDSLFDSASNDFYKYTLVADPIKPNHSRNFLSADFYTGELPEELEAKIPYKPLR